MHHLRKTQQDYRRHAKNDRKSTGCPLCLEGTRPDRIVYSDDSVFIIPNRTKYDFFETLPVEEHLLLLPKRHVESIDDMTDEEKLTIMNIIGEYEKQGYSVYARGVGGIQRSQKHQHTHLLKLKSSRTKSYLYLSKPYLVVRK